MNAVDNATLERIYRQGKRQRKYVGKISESAQELADLVIAAAVSCENSQGVYWISFTQDDNVTDCEIRQSDCIMSISLISLGAPVTMWPRNYYKLGKTITQYIVDAIAAKQSNQPEAAAGEAPASDTRYYVQQISDPYGEDVVNSWFVFDRRELDKNGVDTCKESNVSYRDAVALCDDLNKSDSIMKRAHELREKLVYKHYPRDPSLFSVGDIPQPLAELEALRQQVGDLQVLITELRAELEESAKELSEANIWRENDKVYTRKLEADLQAAQAIIVDAGKQVETAKRIALNLAEKNAQTRKEVQAVIDRLGKDIDESNSISAPRIAHYRLELKKAIADKSASKESAQKKVVSKRMRVNWSGRGFSSGDYEVLGHSQEKQAYVLNISTDENKPMPKWVKFADCQ